MRGRPWQNLTTGPDPLQDDQVLHVGVHESAWTQVDASVIPAGSGVRIIATSYSETVSKATRCKTLWNLGFWPIPCLADFNGGFTISESSGPSATYDAQVAAFLAECDSGGVRRGDAFEVTNEPSSTSEQKQALRAIAGCYARLRLAGRRVLIPHSIQNVSFGNFITLLKNPDASTGHCTPDMIDGWVFHSYGTTAEGRIDGLKTLRDALDDAEITVPIFLTETGWPSDRLGRMDAVSANPGTGWPADGYSGTEVGDRIQDFYDFLIPGAPDHAGVNARSLKLRAFIYFCYADYNPGATNGYNHIGLVEQDTRASAGPPNYQDNTGGGGGWVLHPTPYDGRAKGSGTAGPPPPYGPAGGALAVYRGLGDYAVALGTTSPGDPIPVGGPTNVQWDLIKNYQFASLPADWTIQGQASGDSGRIYGPVNTAIFSPSGNSSQTAAKPGNVTFVNDAEASDGKALRVDLAHSTYATQPNAGALLHTLNGYAFTGGYIEFRAKMPSSDKSSFLVWTDAASHPGPGGDWAQYGEHDIAEGLGESDTPKATIHKNSVEGAGSTDTKTWRGGGPTVGDADGTYHTWGMFWEPPAGPFAGRMRFYCNGALFSTYTPSVDSGWVASTDHILVIYLVAFDGSDPPASDFALIDYVRHWQPV